ncbi:MAG: L7Ae/L30e/S12e/Gadd45 family ribosomal protein [Longimicrobiales bacterium]
MTSPPIAPDRALDMLGLAARAGSVVSGTGPVRDAIRTGRAAFVVVASDISRNTAEKLIPLLRHAQVAWVRRFERVTLGAAVGRAPVAAIAVLEPSLAARVQALLGQGHEVDSEEPFRR